MSEPALEDVVLTPRERQVVECVASGFSAKQCARQLAIAPRSVEREVESLRDKLQARNRAHLVAKAVSGGFI